MRAIILAAGFGSRLGAIGQSIPKCLIEVGEKPVLSYWLDALAKAGVKECIINTHHLAEKVADHVLQYKNDRMECQAVYEEKLLGTAGAINKSIEWLEAGGRFLVIYADNISSVDLSDLIAFHATGGCEITMGVFAAEDPTACGIVVTDNNGVVLTFEEKPKSPRSNLANAGLFVIEPQALSNKIFDKDFDLSRDVLPRLVGSIRVYDQIGYHRDIGTPQSLFQANVDFECGDIC